jgi:hypothetical protein
MARVARLSFIPPQLPSLTDQLPEGADAFDLLHLDGKDLFDRPLVERRAKLLELVRHDQESPIQFSEEFIGDAAAFFRACAAHELEGRSERGFRGKAWQTETGLLRLAGSLHRKNPRVSFLPF